MKSDTLILRTSPDIRSALKFIFTREKRSMSSMIDFLDTDCRKKNGVALPDGKPGRKGINDT